MRLAPLHAEADIVGGRVQLAWSFALDAGAGETPADVPDVELRRKERDFEYPAPRAGERDPSLVFSSAPGFDESLGDRVDSFEIEPAHLASPHLVATVRTVSAGNPAVEVLRWTNVIERDDQGRVARVEHRVVDVGGSPTGLVAGEPCYYELRILGPLPGEDEPRPPSRAIATPTARHGTGKWMYDALPSIHTRHDTTLGPLPLPGALPEARRDHGQLRRFVDVFGCALDHLRSRAEALDTIRDVDATDARVLPRMAEWIGWDLAVDRPIPEQRHEVRHAAHLYRITGTLPGCRLWVRRLSGWDPDVKEFWPNVMFSNDLGNPDDPRDKGSRTVDTSDAGLLASLGGPDDQGDYTHDASDRGRYALNKVGFFITPEPDDTASSVRARRARILDNQALFLPFSMRAVVIMTGDDDVTDETLAVPVTEIQEG